ncbi:MAG: amidase [Casimicrobiaceae bacterium]|nr:amidase [Casimicrobiaceae bacterium]
MERLCWLTAADLERQYAAGLIDPVHVVESVARRMDACEPHLNAIYLRKDFDALALAQESRARLHAREGGAARRSPLDGVPVTVKENVYTRGDPSPIGTAANPLTPKTENAPLVDRLVEAGAIVVAKTTMPDFGMLTSGRSSLHGTTRNPWRLDRNPGGSSSGAAAACAAGYGPLHIGTDIGGSIRLPAHFCGIFGLKPSLGRVPINPPYMGRVAGPMTRTVRDAALLMNVIARPDPAHRDFMNLPPDQTDYAAALERFEVKGKRIAVLTRSVYASGIDAEIVTAVESCAQALERLGADLVPIEPFVNAADLDAVGAFFEARSHAEIFSMPQAQRERILPFIVQWVSYRAPRFTGEDLIGFLNRMYALRERTVQATHAFDFVLSPVCRVLAFGAEQCCPGDDPTHALEHIEFTAPYNLSEQPAASINWSYATSAEHAPLPIGVQVAGRRFDDLGVLQLCRVIEQIRPPQRPWPLTHLG